jgi:aspartate/methionine/tyrosine aminotransferase
MLSRKKMIIVSLFGLISSSLMSMIEIELPSIKRVEALAQSTPGCISLAQGALRIGGVDQQIKEYVRQVLLTDKADYYQDTLGLLALRQRLAQTLTERSGAAVDVRNVMIGHGGIGVLNALMLLLLDAGDEVLLPEPAYPVYTTLARLAKATPQFVSAYDLQPDNVSGSNKWTFSIERVKAAVTDKTKMIIISNPSNPTGVFLSRAEMTELVALSERKQIYLIVDEVYDDFIYEGTFTSGTAYAINSPYVIRLGSFSKNFGMGGWRVGYAVAQPRLITALAPVHAATISNATVVSQYAALYALEQPHCVAGYRAILEKNMTAVCALFDQLQAQGVVTYARPAAGFYLFFKTQVANANDAVMDILREANVALTPGTDFGPSAQGYIRLCFARDPEVIQHCLMRIKNYFDKKK